MRFPHRFSARKNSHVNAPLGYVHTVDFDTELAADSWGNSTSKSDGIPRPIHLNVKFAV